MKKSILFAMMSAIALSGSVLISCSSGDEIVDNPDYNPVDNTVKTQFSFSFPQNVARVTRQSSATVQLAEDHTSFRGISNFLLIPFNAIVSAGTQTALNTGITVNNMTKPISSTTANTIPAYNTESSKSSLMENNNSVLYEDVEIPVGTAAFLFYGKAIGDDGDTNGQLDVAGFPTSSSTSFLPGDVTFTPHPIFSSTNDIGNAIMNGLTDIATVPNFASDGTLGGTYTALTQLTIGSSAAVETFLSWMYTNVNAVTSDVATNVKTKIEVMYDATTGKLRTGYTGYPANINLPDGAARISWVSAQNKFVDASTVSSGSYTSLSLYTYPASLYYWTNSAVKTSDEKRIDKFTTAATWSAIASDSNYPGNTVTGTTRSVVITNPIEYAVGRLDTKVSLAAGTLYDYAGNAVTEATAENLPISAILVGGQKQVDWQFLPVSGTDVTEYTIYDNAVSDMTPNGNSTNYTLVLETAAATSVKIAIEFTNNTGADFIGAGGKVIPDKHKFYLIGELDPAKGSKPSGNPSLNQVFKQDYHTTANVTVKTNSTAGGGNGLGAATEGLPDLRISGLELGLSIDLTWQPGLTFTETW